MKVKWDTHVGIHNLRIVGEVCRIALVSKFGKFIVRCVVFNVALHTWHGNLQFLIQGYVKFTSSSSWMVCWDTCVAQITFSMYTSDMSSSPSARCVGIKKYLMCELSASSSSDNYSLLGCNGVQFYKLVSIFRRKQWAKVYVVTLQKVVILLLWTVFEYH